MRKILMAGIPVILSAAMLIAAPPAQAHDSGPPLAPEPPVGTQVLAAIPCSGGVADVYACNKVDLLSQMPLSTIGGGSGNDIWGWTDPTNGKEYAIVGRTSGTAFVDISSPTSPVYLGNLPTATSNSSWRDMKVYANHAYIVSEAGSHGLQVFDLTRLRNVTSPPVTFTADARNTSFGNAHNISINEETGFAYVIGSSTCSGGPRMFDLSSPKNPAFAGCVSGDGYSHDTQGYVYQGPDTAHRGKEILFSSNEDTVTIVDVTTKSNPIQLSRTGYTGRGYTHQGWLTEDHRYFLLDDETDETSRGHNTRTYVWDVADLDNPVMIGFYTGTTAASDHNLYVKGKYAYESNYRAGLRIIDLTNIANPSTMTEAAFFDVYPESNSNGFAGAWSAFPYFPSGNVIVNSIQRGLFVLKPNLGTPANDFSIAVSPTSGSTNPGGSLTATVNTAVVSGSAQTVNLSASGAPAGVSVSFSPSSVTAGNSSTMTVATSASAAPGTYLITVTGTGTSATRTASFKIGRAHV